jgi:excisionase family DNA binding protein
MKLLSTPEAAEALGVTVARVQQLIWNGRLPAQKIGGSYVIQEGDLELIRERPTGRPPKNKVSPSSKVSKKKDNKD